MYIRVSAESRVVTLRHVVVQRYRAMADYFRSIVLQLLDHICRDRCWNREQPATSTTGCRGRIGCSAEADEAPPPTDVEEVQQPADSNPAGERIEVKVVLEQPSEPQKPQHQQQQQEQQQHHHHQTEAEFNNEEDQQDQLEQPPGIYDDADVEDEPYPEQPEHEDDEPEVGVDYADGRVDAPVVDLIPESAAMTQEEQQNGDEEDAGILPPFADDVEDPFLAAAGEPAPQPPVEAGTQDHHHSHHRLPCFEYEIMERRCLNGGHCFAIEVHNGIRHSGCSCPSSWTGERCELRYIDPSIWNEVESDDNYRTAGTGSVTCFLLLASCLFLSAVYAYRYNRRRQCSSPRHLRDKEMLLSPVVDQTFNSIGYTKTYSSCADDCISCVSAAQPTARATSPPRAGTDALQQSAAYGHQPFAVMSSARGEETWSARRPSVALRAGCIGPLSAGCNHPPPEAASVDGAGSPTPPPCAAAAICRQYDFRSDHAHLAVAAAPFRAASRSVA